MSLRLRVASRWLPKSILLRALECVDELTTGALDALLEEYAPASLKEVQGGKAPMAGGLDERRAIMANAHNLRVAALVDALGREEAVRLGRCLLFQVGMRLGQEARLRLGVGDSVGDILRAARVLYRVLGIDFEVQWEGKNRALLVVNRCALAAHYSEVACLVLSAADEGVIQGLNPRVSMAFQERITAGAPKCMARLKLDKLNQGGKP